MVPARWYIVDGDVGDGMFGGDEFWRFAIVALPFVAVGGGSYSVRGFSGCVGWVGEAFLGVPSMSFFIENFLDKPLLTDNVGCRLVDALLVVKGGSCT